MEIIDPFQCHGKFFVNIEILSKISKALPKDWEAKQTSIEEADQVSLKVEEFLSFLWTPWIKIGQESRREVKEEINCIQSHEWVLKLMKAMIRKKFQKIIEVL